MVLRVVDTFPVGGDTSVTVEGDGAQLRNNMAVADSKGNAFELLSVCMTADKTGADKKNETTVLIKGRFNSATLHI